MQNEINNAIKKLLWLKFKSDEEVKINDYPANEIYRGMSIAYKESIEIIKTMEW